MIRVSCSSCRTVLDRPNSEAGLWIECSVCAQSLYVPPPRGTVEITANPDPARPKYVPGAGPPAEESSFRNPYAPREDDGPVDHNGRMLATRDARIGFACAVGSFGCLFFLFFWWVLVVSRGGRPQRDFSLLFLFLFILVGFVTSTIGIVFSSRGMNRSNDYNQSLALSGFIVNILGMSLISLVGAFLSCMVSVWR